MEILLNECLYIIIINFFQRNQKNNLEFESIIGIEHVFEGQVNRRGSAVGYHYESIENTAGQVIDGTATAPNEFGVYKAQVEVNGIPKTGNGGASTFFPKEMSPQEVVNAINEAYDVKVFKSGNEFYGYSSISQV